MTNPGTVNMPQTLRAAFCALVIFCAASATRFARAESTPFRNTTPTFVATYKSGNFNTLTIKGANFALYSLLNLQQTTSAGFSVAGGALISVLTSNANGEPIVLTNNILTSNGNYYYTVVVSKKDLSKAVCKAANKQLPLLSFTATNDNPPSKGIFSLTFVIQNVTALPTTTTKSPSPTLQGLPNLTLQIGSAYFTTSHIKKNKATYP